MYLGKTGQKTQTCHANLNNIPQDILKKKIHHIYSVPRISTFVQCNFSFRDDTEFETIFVQFIATYSE